MNYDLKHDTKVGAGHERAEFLVNPTSLQRLIGELDIEAPWVSAGKSIYTNYGSVTILYHGGLEQPDIEERLAKMIADMQRNFLTLLNDNTKLRLRLKTALQRIENLIEIIQRKNP